MLCGKAEALWQAGMQVVLLVSSSTFPAVVISTRLWLNDGRTWAFKSLSQGASGEGLEFQRYDN
jgi:hypothetical protein